VSNDQVLWLSNGLWSLGLILEKKCFMLFSSRHGYILESIEVNFSEVNPKPENGGAEAGVWKNLD